MSPALASPAPLAALAAALGAGAALGLLAGVEPAIALALALGCAFLLVVATNVVAGIAVFTLIAFAEFVPATAGPMLSLAKITGLVLALGWIAARSSASGRSFELAYSQPVLAFALLAFLGWTAVTTVWAEQPDVALEATSRYALSIVLLLIVATSLRKARHARVIAAAFVVGAVAAAVAGIVTPVSEADATRLAGTIGDPNELAALLVAGLVLAVGLVPATRTGTASRAGLVAAAALCAAGVLMTGSRGGIVAAFAALVAALLVGGRWRAQALALGAVLALAGGVYLATFAPAEISSRIGLSDGGTGRADIWKVGWRMVDDRPLLGVGAGNFEVSSVHYLLEPGEILRDEFILDTPKVAHNMYLDILAESGVIGLALFLAIVAACLAAAVRAADAFSRLENDAMEALARTTIVAIAAMLTADFFLSGQFTKQLWLLLALGPALLTIARLESESQRHEPQSSHQHPRPEVPVG